MSSHKTEVFEEGGRFYGKCSCRMHTGGKLTKQAAEDELIAHLRQVERVRLHLESRNPQLKTQYAHYRKMEADPDVSEYDRRLWKQLADELERRLGVDADDDPLPLF